MRVRLTRAEWDGLQEYNRRLLCYWRETGGCLPWEVVQREVLEARPGVVLEMLREGFELPPRIVFEVERELEVAV